MLLASLSLLEFSIVGIVDLVWKEVGESPSSSQHSIMTRKRVFIYYYLPQNAINDKQDAYSKANESGEEAQTETMGLIEIGLPQSKK